MSIKDDVRSTIEQFFEAMDDRDLEAMKTLIPKSDSTIHIGTDAGEYWEGWETLVEATKEQFSGLEYYKANIRDLTITVGNSEDVAWYFHRLDAEIKSNGEVVRLNNARFTGVLQKQENSWKIAQTHVSSP